MLARVFRIQSQKNSPRKRKRSGRRFIQPALLGLSCHLVGKDVCYDAFQTSKISQSKPMRKHDE
jgi:hypothetical protein